MSTVGFTPSRGTALHEARHAVTAEVLGVRIDHVSVMPKTDGNRGASNGRVQLSPARMSTADLAAMFAGHVTKYVPPGTDGEWLPVDRGSSRGDLEAAEEAAAFIADRDGGSAEVLLYKAQALADEMCERNSATIERVADVLMERLFLSGNELRAVMTAAGCRPNPSTAAPLPAKRAPTAPPAWFLGETKPVRGARVTGQRSRFPVDNLIRAVGPSHVSVRGEGMAGRGRGGAMDRATSDETSVLVGHFAVFNVWTEIDSWFEGRFMERLELGAFKRSFAEERAGMRVLLEHGQDPQLGNKPIATIADLLEETAGAYYEAPLLEGVPLLVVAGIRAGQYGASFRFRVEREEIVEDPGVSEHNPHGLPERTIKEVSCMEFGPVTWGAYPTATAGMRSLTAEFMERAHSRG